MKPYYQDEYVTLYCGDCRELLPIIPANSISMQERDYKVIITVAEKIPNNVLEEDPKLLMWYDQAVTRVGGE